MNSTKDAGFPVIGIDEAGRGPLAGPLVVCALHLVEEIDLFEGKEFRDSKKLSEKKRTLVFSNIQREARAGKLKYAVRFVSPETIDRMGISASLKLAVKEVLKKLRIKNSERVILDGSLKAPEIFSNQTTVIRGDESELPIALASIVAKVLRDKEMVKLAHDFPSYGFDKHKGYGTKEHQEALRQFGVSETHRRSFCRKFL